MNRIRHSQKARGLFALLLLCALAMRVLIPAGFMPVQSPSGIIVTLCTGQGAVQAFLPLERDGDHQPLAEHEKADPPCAFATGSGAALPDLHPYTLPAFFALSLILVSRAFPHLIIHRLAAPPPPSQAPPVRR